jgi:hypothetical protein
VNVDVDEIASTDAILILPSGNDVGIISAFPLREKLKRGATHIAVNTALTIPSHGPCVEYTV